MIPQIVILAGGKGLRLAERLRRPDGEMLPKPLVPVKGVPLLERQMRHAAVCGANNIVILVNHKAEAIEAFCRNNAPDGITIRIIDDGIPRGTAGAVFNALDSLDEEFCVMYGDTLLNVNLERFYIFHTSHNADITVMVHPNDHPHDSDLLDVDEDGTIKAIHAYPHPEGANYRNIVNAALYYVRKKALMPFKNMDQPIDFAKDLFPLMLAKGQKIMTYASDEYIKDIGTPDRLDRAEKDIESGKFIGEKK